MKESNSFWVYTGYVLTLFIFSIILYFVLKMSGKLPDSWTYLSVILIVFFLVTFGKTIKYVLKKP